MIKKLLALSVTFAFLTIPNIIFAEVSISSGKAKAASCAGCHGEDGNSMVSTFPKLAGQHASYLVEQLQDLKDGFRNAPMMAPLAMELDDESIIEIAAFYATQKISANQLPFLESDDEDDDDKDMSAELDELLAIGSDLYRNGNVKENVSACIACHGPVGEGNKPASFPVLRSQHADYLIKSLTDFKNGTRSNKSDNMMHMIAKKMTDKEIKAVSFHISMKK